MRIAGFTGPDSTANQILNRPQVASEISCRLYGPITRDPGWAQSKVRALAGGSMENFVIIVPDMNKDGSPKLDVRGSQVYKLVPDLKKALEAGALGFLEEVQWHPDGTVKKFKTARFQA